MTGKGGDGSGDDKSATDPGLPLEFDNEKQRQRQVNEARQALAGQDVVDLADWRKSTDAEAAKVILGRIRDERAKPRDR